MGECVRLLGSRDLVPKVDVVMVEKIGLVGGAKGLIDRQVRERKRRRNG